MLNVHVYIADVLRVIDGDTVELLVDQGLRQYHKSSFRLTMIDTPETYGRKSTSAEYKHGKQATERLIELINNQERDTPKTLVEKILNLRGVTDIPVSSVLIESRKHGKYRWLCTLYPISCINDDVLDPSKSFNQILIDEGFEKLEIYPEDK